LALELASFNIIYAIFRSRKQAGTPPQFSAAAAAAAQIPPPKVSHMPPTLYEISSYAAVI